MFVVNVKFKKSFSIWIKPFCKKSDRRSRSYLLFLAGNRLSLAEPSHGNPPSCLDCFPDSVRLLSVIVAKVWRLLFVGCWFRYGSTVSKEKNPKNVSFCYVHKMWWMIQHNQIRYEIYFLQFAPLFIRFLIFLMKKKRANKL